MTNYTTEDFTDIRGPDEKPTVPGWYVTHYGREYAEHLMGIMENCHWTWFDWWDGAAWRQDPNSPKILDARCTYWFGLKEKP